MRNRFFTRMTVAGIATCVAAAVTLVTAQTPGYRAPRAPDGKPNLNGIWQAIRRTRLRRVRSSSSGRRAPCLLVSVLSKAGRCRIRRRRSRSEMRIARIGSSSILK